jgi:hypothetical protein
MANPALYGIAGLGAKTVPSTVNWFPAYSMSPMVDHNPTA